MFRRKEKDGEQGAGKFGSRTLFVQDLFAPDGIPVGFDRSRGRGRPWRDWWRNSGFYH